MFRALKTPYEFEVSLHGDIVRVKQLPTQKSAGLVGRTIGRCEEFLAQAFIREQHASNTLYSLVRFFRQRGWQVMHSA